MKKSNGHDPAKAPDTPAAVDTGLPAFPNFERVRVPLSPPAEGVPAMLPRDDMRPSPRAPARKSIEPPAPDARHWQFVPTVEAINDSGSSQPAPPVAPHRR